MPFFLSAHIASGYLHIISTSLKIDINSGTNEASAEGAAELVSASFAVCIIHFLETGVT